MCIRDRATIARNATTIDTRTYDDGGRMASSVYNNGVSETRAYNDDNTLASINFAGADVGDLTYGWDDNKNKTSEDITGTMSGYGFNNTSYDDEDRLVSWNRTDNALSKSWNLSLVGDWDSVTENGTQQDRTHGPTHEMLTAAGEAISTDTRGNMTSIPAALRPGNDPLNLTWDFDNRMSSADVDNDGTDDVSYQFDALGRRVANDNGTNTTIYVQSGQQTIADYTSGVAPASPTYTYYYASYIDEPVMRAGVGALRYYHRGQQYSITALTDSSGNVTERYAYTAYGTPTITDAAGATLTISTDNNRYTYTGREWDETLSLYHYRARMYDSIGGRFCSRDPIGYQAFQISRYALTYSTPTKYVDPHGLAAIIPFAPGIEVVSSRAVPCFDVEIGFKFIIPKQLSFTSGYIVQEIKTETYIEDCSGKDITASMEGAEPLHYFEAFKLSSIRLRENIRVPDDTYGNGGNFTRTRGKIEVKGVAKGAANWELPDGFLNPPPPGPWGTLPMSPDEPSGWDMIEGTKHDMTIEWDCCCEKHRLKVLTTPEWSRNDPWDLDDPDDFYNKKWPKQYPIEQRRPY